MSCGVGRRHSLDPALLWLWRRPAATAPIRPLVWEPPYAVGAAQEMEKRQKKKKQKTKQSRRYNSPRLEIILQSYNNQDSVVLVQKQIYGATKASFLLHNSIRS